MFIVFFSYYIRPNEKSLYLNYVEVTQKLRIGKLQIKLNNRRTIFQIPVIMKVKYVYCILPSFHSLHEVVERRRYEPCSKYSMPRWMDWRDMTYMHSCTLADTEK